LAPFLYRLLKINITKFLAVDGSDMMVLGMGWHKPDNFAGSSSRAITIGLFVASGGLLFGYDLG
jgi:hypothetical protein